MPYPDEDAFTYDPAPLFTNPAKNTIGDWIAGIARTLQKGLHVSSVFGSFGTAKARLDDMDTRTVKARNTGYRNLVVAPDAATPASKVVVAADLLEIEGHVAENVAVTIDITATGLNGRDTGTEAADTWYPVWAGYDPANKVSGGTVSTSTTRAGLTLTAGSFAGYTAWRRVGFVRNDGSGNFIPFLQVGPSVLYQCDVDTTVLVSAGQASSFTAVATATMQKYLPPGARHALLACILKVTGNTGVSSASRADLRFRPGGSTSATGAVRAAASWVPTTWIQVQAATEQVWTTVSASRDLDYKINVATGGSATEYAADVAVAGYLDGGV